MRATYREPPPRRIRVMPEPPAAVETWRDAGVFGSIAAAAGGGAVACGQLELVVLAGAGAVAAVVQLARAAQQRRQRDAVLQFLGEEFVEEPGSWTSLDGARRLRAVAGDPHLRWERLDPTTGETLASFRSSAPHGPDPAPPVGAVLERGVARVHGRARDPRCFRGLPPELGGRFPRALRASSVVLEVRRGGATLTRCTADGELAGDTFHADRAGAIRQLTAEYGDRADALAAELPVARPVAHVWDGARTTRFRL